ncbi:MAG: leucyl-tRNA---protein transferase [Candidatus Parcubacteria bacterium]|jgi:arginyl-tRNA--protein-N-Asp/Glu arginylyltransferase|nr:leucyl-tRNA---protein transferase [Candidatus Parcubacteria bacterium]
MPYLYWDKTTVSDFSEKNISLMYSRGYLFTRLGKGDMQQTRSARIDLSNHSETSENRRILKKLQAVDLESEQLPLKDYDWRIGKLGKDFYDAKFGPRIMSAQKIKEMLIYGDRSNFNILLAFREKAGHVRIGYAICYGNKDLMHYSYPFYDLGNSPKDMGLGMMVLAVRDASAAGKKFVYLGSLQRPSDTYKLQFAGLEWFDGTRWQRDQKAVKKILSSDKMAQ